VIHLDRVRRFLGVMRTRIGKRSREFAQWRCFGAGEGDLDPLPGKLGSAAAARIRHCKASGGCGFCFPHGVDSDSWSVLKRQRSWKSHRKTQYRDR
jgi:hypothetical protein